MNPTYRARLRRLLGVSAAIVALVVAGYCHRATSGSRYPHLAFWHNAGETLTIDSMDSRVAMDSNDGPPNPRLECFLVSWSDDIAHDDELGMAQREKYIQFGLRRDWVALAGGDSIYADYFRQRPLLDRHLHQWALVYPVPAGRHVDSLAYVGTQAAWGKRTFILIRK